MPSLLAVSSSLALSMTWSGLISTSNRDGENGYRKYQHGCDELPGLPRIAKFRSIGSL